jgi:hypothetical protein
MRNVFPCGRTDDGDDPTQPAEIVSAAPILVRSGPLLGQLCIWSDTGWDALPGSRRPRESVHAPGLGWVGLRIVDCLN